MQKMWSKIRTDIKRDMAMKKEVAYSRSQMNERLNGFAALHEMLFSRAVRS